MCIEMAAVSDVPALLLLSRSALHSKALAGPRSQQRHGDGYMCTHGGQLQPAACIARLRPSAISSTAAI